MNHLHGYPHAEDEALVDRIHRGGPDAERALKELYLNYRKRISAYLLNLMHRFPGYKGDPLDLVHDSFIVLTQRIEKEEGPFHSLCAYWMGISRLLFLNQLKKDERMILVGEPEEVYLLADADGPDYPHENEAMDRLETAFDLLGSRCQEILLLWGSRYSMDEISTRMGLSGVAMARKIKHECFKKLKKLVRDGNKWPG